MRPILASLLLALTLGCGGEPLEAPPQECEVVKAWHPAATPNPCIFQVPPGLPCDGIRVFADGEEVQADGFNFVCSAGQIVLLGDACPEDVGVCSE